MKTNLVRFVLLTMLTINVSSVVLADIAAPEPEKKELAAKIDKKKGIKKKYLIVAAGAAVLALGGFLFVRSRKSTQ